MFGIPGSALTLCCSHSARCGGPRCRPLLRLLRRQQWYIPDLATSILRFIQKHEQHHPPVTVTYLGFYLSCSSGSVRRRNNTVHTQDVIAFHQEPNLTKRVIISLQVGNTGPLYQFPRDSDNSGRPYGFYSSILRMVITLLRVGNTDSLHTRSDPEQCR